MVRDGGGICSLWNFERYDRRGRQRGHGGRGGGGGALPGHGRGHVPVERRDVCDAGLRAAGWTQPNAARDPDTLAALSGNVSANLLGLGNAATPLGVKAARRMAAGCGGRATDELCRLVVLNTASIQLLPTTVAGVRGALGAANPFDILPAVWLASALSVTAGLLAAGIFSKIWRD